MAISWCIMDLQSTELKQCPICKGSGKVVVGYGVICMEIVEKVKKCPECKGKGRIYY
jgi:DnaJ-class molecular chaperone